MKLFFALTALAAAAFAAVNPGLLQVKRVYLVSMASSMDQYLANQLTNSGVFEVVTDPKRADAIVTDNVGDSFQRQLDDLYPPPKPPEEKKAKGKEDETEEADSDSGTNSKKASRKNAFEGIDFSGGTAHVNSFGRGKGNIFLVDRNSRVVLWSVYERPKNSTPGELTKTAARIVKHLHDDMNPKKPGAEN
ncbi:MAG TPA: hypothetical protein VFW44_02130 [Bryobacteraceae bacterium]|nr:hypothetical protein [Bryobacteraceae bacterium]